VAIVFTYPAGATPLDPEDAAALVDSHVTTQGQVDELEFKNVAAGLQWAFTRAPELILTTEFMQHLHERMFGDTWKWAGVIRKKETLPVGVAPETIRARLVDLCGDVEAQLKHGNWTIDEIAARFHHRLVFIHPFTNGNGRFSRTMADLLLVKNERDPFDWGPELGRNGEGRKLYIAALREADAKNYEPLRRFLAIKRRLEQAGPQ
jgi:Fic-DOC domain mobile mystery protein B